jgi:hypothetical protein
MAGLHDSMRKRIVLQDGKFLSVAHGQIGCKRK